MQLDHHLARMLPAPKPRPAQVPASNSGARKRTTRGEQLAAAHLMTHAELHAAADGCTELSCVHHGAVNEVRLERGIR